MQALFSVVDSLPVLLQILVVGLTLLGLYKGSDFVITGGRSVARRFGISEMVIGLTIVSIGSSFPEIFVNIAAGLRGADDIGVGNVVGSCFVQISMILGICVLVGGAMTEHKRTIIRDGGMLLGSILLLFALGFDGTISRSDSFVMMAIYIAYISYLIGKGRHQHGVERKQSSSPILVSIGTFVLGAVLVWFSAEILIHIGIAAGQSFGLSDSIIGLMTGIGTSIPELAVSLMALLRHSNGISVGNLLGSNITDPLLSLPIGASLAGGFGVNDFLLFQAIPTWALASAIVVGVFYAFGSLNRYWATGLIALYCSAFFFFLV